MKSTKTAVWSKTSNDAPISYGKATVVTSRLNKGGDMKFKGKRG